MRVLLVCDWAVPEGGAERYATWLRDGLRAAGDDVRLLASSVGPGSTDGRPDFVARTSTRKAAQALLQLANPDAVRTARAAVRQFDPHVVHVVTFEHHLSPAVFLAFRDVPTVLMVLNYKPICPVATKLLPSGELCTSPAGIVCARGGCVGWAHWLRDRPRYRLIGWALRRADRVLATGASFSSTLASYSLVAEPVVHGVPAPGEDYRRAPAPEPTFLFAGRLVREKGADVLLRAFARLRARDERVRLRIAGDGPERAALERLAAELGVRDAVAFLGQLDYGAYERELAPAWALVAPSLWAEPFGLAAVEAVVRGVPVIASRTGGFAESVEHGVEGLLVANGDVGELADALREVAARRAFPTLALDPSRVAAARERHDLARHVAEVRSVLAEAAAARRSAA